MSKAKKGRRWREAQRNDPFVKAAKAQGWRSRAAMKLIEINDKHHLFKGKQRILELGAAPGSWTQVVRALVPQASIIAVDRLAMDPIEGATVIQGDCEDEVTCEKIMQSMQGLRCDLLLSDMAPNITGIHDVDQAGWLDTITFVFQFIENMLQKNGDCCMKIFHNDHFKAAKNALQASFERVSVVKPSASKAKSREVYLFACGYSGIMSEWVIDSNEEDDL